MSSPIKREDLLECDIYLYMKFSFLMIKLKIFIFDDKSNGICSISFNNYKIFAFLWGKNNNNFEVILKTQKNNKRKKKSMVPNWYLFNF